MVGAHEYCLVYSPCQDIVLSCTHRTSLHRHPFFEPAIVLSGKGEFEHGTETVPLSRGDLFMADPGVEHEIRSPAARDLRICSLAFNLRKTGARESASAAIVERKMLTPFLRHHRHHLSDQTHLVPLFEHVLQLSRHDEDYLRSGFYHDSAQLLLRQIIAALSGLDAPLDSEHEERNHSNRIVTAIERRLHEPFRIADLARDCGMSERTLRRRWQRLGTRPLTDEINYRRIWRACQLLLLPDVPVAEVGFQVGIPSPARFSRLFRQEMRTTPSAYRRAHLGKLPGFMPG